MTSETSPGTVSFGAAVDADNDGRAKPDAKLRLLFQVPGDEATHVFAEKDLPWRAMPDQIENTLHDLGFEVRGRNRVTMESYVLDLAKPPEHPERTREHVATDTYVFDLAIPPPDPDWTDLYRYVCVRCGRIYTNVEQQRTAPEL